MPWFGQAHGLSKFFIEVKSCESDWFKYNVFYSDKCYGSYSMDLQLYSNALGWSPKGASEFSWFFVWAVKLSKFFSHIWQSPGGHLSQAMYLGLAWIIAIAQSWENPLQWLNEFQRLREVMGRYVWDLRYAYLNELEIVVWSFPIWVVVISWMDDIGWIYLPVTNEGL